MKIINLATLFIFLLLIPSSIFQATAQMEGLNWEHPAFDRTNTGFSPQTQITKDNINDLELRWIFQVPGYWGSGGGVPGEVIAVEGDGHAGHDHGGEGGFNFEVPHVPTGVQTVPLVVNGIVYIASEFNVLYALNAENSQLLWRFAAPIGSFDEKDWWARVYAQHGIDYFDDKVWMQASDCTIYGLDPMTGEVLVTIPDTCKDIPGNTGIYWASFAPIEYNNLLITRPTGGGGFTGERGFISAYDKDTGELVWRWETIPPTGNEEDWAADLVSKGNLDNYPWDWGKCEKVEHAGHGEEDEEGHEEHGEEDEEGHEGHGHGDVAEINYLTAEELQLLAMVTGITINVHEFEERATEIGVANDEITEIVHEIEERLDDVTRDIQSDFFAKERLDELIHEVEEHVHELEESVSDEGLLSILTDIEDDIDEFESFELEGPTDEHIKELLAIMAEIEANVHEFEEKAPRLPLNMGMVDEILNIVSEIEEHVGDVTHEIEHPHGGDLIEMMHVVEEHVHELEDMLSPISDTDELLALLANVESGIAEFEEHYEAEEHAGHGEEDEEGHEGHGHDEERKNGLHDCNWIGGGSVWTLIALDEDTGDIFFTTNAPTPDVPGDMRPGPNLFTASVVSLNANTGEMNWYYQIVTHDVYYHESRWSTILAEIESGDSTQKAVIVGSKTNLVHVLDADTGKPIYESIRVGPPAINTQQADMGNNADMELSQADLVRQQVCPGFQGGIDAAPAFAHNTIYVVTQTFCTSYIEEEGAPYKDGVADIFHHVAGPIYFDSFHVGNSSLYAIDASNGRVKWVYEMENRNQYGAVTTSGGIVFVPDRMGMIHAVDEETGELLRIFTTGGLGGAGVSIGFNAYGQATLFITSGGAGEFGQRTTGILQAWTLPDGSVTETSSSETTPDLLSLVSLGIAVLAIGFSVYVTRKNRSN
tara:strand:- start:193 stop:2994 length:2802 start_codon:yes stop_codon:yes gene_type:complete